MKRPHTILVVEDNTPLRKFIASQLKEHGYRVLDASNGRDALAMAARAGPIHVLLSDLILEGPMDGLDLGDALLRLKPGARILFMSGYAGTFADRLELESLCDFFLAKPFTSKTLIEMVDACLEKVDAGRIIASRALPLARR